MLYFKIIIISRDEDDHAMLKRQLRSLTQDLKNVLNKIKLLLINQLHDYKLTFEVAKILFFIELRKSIYDQLVVFVALNVLRNIAEQHDLLIEQSTVLSFGSRVFFIITRLSCLHTVQKPLFNDERLLLKDVYSYWWY